MGTVLGIGEILTMSDTVYHRSSTKHDHFGIGHRGRHTSGKIAPELAPNMAAKTITTAVVLAGIQIARTLMLVRKQATPIIMKGPNLSANLVRARRPKMLPCVVSIMTIQGTDSPYDEAHAIGGR